ncbi:MAG: DAK2 domain-containing protein [Acidimicrobiales bacterium]
MEVLDRLGPEHLRAVIVGYRDALAAHRGALNRLNVYPVPDGDTGTNMALTLESVVAELPEDSADAGMAAVCRAVAHGSLMGARGNSGVILSQVLRGLTNRLSEVEAADGTTLAQALAESSDAAYRAVMHPVEGTILTVIREAAEAAVARGDAPLVDVLDDATAASRDALRRTPELLAVLAEAGVVDAGGAGLVLLFEVLLNVIAGRPVSDPPAEADTPNFSRSTTLGVDQRDKNEVGGGPRYEVMFLLEAPDTALDDFKACWDGLGDSIVVVGGEGTRNCNVHTDAIGAAVEAGIRAGRPYRIEVTDLSDQVAHVACGNATTAANPPTPEQEVPVATGVVAVGAGEGIGRILRNLGVGRVVAGGQSMNPSTAEILAAVDDIAAKEVIVLPNNKNVVAVAEQAAASAARPVRVIPTTSVTAAFAALLAYDADTDAETNVAAMADACGQVTTAEVTQAVREASTAAGPVKAGDWLGVTPAGIAVVAPSAADAACALLDRLVGENHELVTVVEGEGSSADGTLRITEWLDRHRPGVAVEVHDGGQPLAAWLLSIE